MDQLLSALMGGNLVVLLLALFIILCLFLGIRIVPQSEQHVVERFGRDPAVGMAGGYAQTRRYHSHEADAGEVMPASVVNLHITPGLAHGIGNVYAAKWAGVPMVVTAGNHEKDFRHEEPLLTGDLERMVEQFCKWSDEVLDVRALPTMLRRAFRVALTPPTGPVFLALPVDVMTEETDREPEPLGPIPNAGGGDPAQIDEAADLLADADDPVLVLGDGVARNDAVDEAIAFAESVGARVHGEILACEVNFPTEHPQWISYIPPNEGLAQMLMGGDVVAFVGCSTNTTLMRHEEPLVDPETTTVHVSDDAWQLGKNEHADAAVLGDPGLVMRSLTERLDDRMGSEERERRVEAAETMRESLAGTVKSMGEDEKPEGDTRASKAELVDAMRSVEPDAFVVDEGITAKYSLLTRWPLADRQMFSNKGGGLGYGLPASVGAALAAREHEEREGGDHRPVVGFIGDGSYLYYPHSLYTAARHDLDLTVVIPDNRNYRILKDNTISMFGGTDEDHDYVGMDFDPHVDIPKNAESHGARGELVETPDAIADAFEDALGDEGPVVLDVLVHD